MDSLSCLFSSFFSIIVSDIEVRIYFLYVTRYFSLAIDLYIKLVCEEFILYDIPSLHIL